MAGNGIDYGHAAWFPVGDARVVMDEDGSPRWEPASVGTARLGDRVVPRSMRVELGDPLAGGPVVDLHLEVIGDRPQCREIRFRSLPAGRELRQGDVDTLRLAETIERMFALSTLPYATEPTIDEWQATLPATRKVVEVARRRPGAPRKVDAAFLERVAEVYRRNVDDRPTATVAAAFDISHSTAAEYVRRARAAGALPPTTPGKRKA